MIELKDYYAITGTGPRGLGQPTKGKQRVNMERWVEAVTYWRGQLTAHLQMELATTHHEDKQLLGVSGGAEGWDTDVLARVCYEMGIPYILVLPLADHGNYYFSKRGSITGADRFNEWQEIYERAIHVVVHPGKMMQFPGSAYWGYQNMVRNEGMVQITVAATGHIVTPKTKDHSGGTQDCLKKAAKAGLTVVKIT